MPTERKTQTVADLTEKMERMQFAVVADYRSMTVAEMREMRAKMREFGGDVVVAKNTLLRIAARETGREALEDLLKGPTAITFAYDDPANAAKQFNAYARTMSKLEVRGAMLGHNVLPADALTDVEKMPSRQEVLAQIVGGVQAPVAGLVGVINAPVNDLVNIINNVVTDVALVLQARIDQLGGEGGEQAAA